MYKPLPESLTIRKSSIHGLGVFARKKLLWDGNNMRITNLEQANQFVGRTYRKGWELS